MRLRIILVSMDMDVTPRESDQDIDVAGIAKCSAAAKWIAIWIQPLMVMTRLSEPLRPEQGVGEVDRQPDGNEGGERIVEDHGRFPQSGSQVYT
jgi:hypothetical protein